MSLSIIQLGHTIYNHCIAVPARFCQSITSFLLCLSRMKKNISLDNLKSVLLEDTYLEIAPLNIVSTGTVPEKSIKICSGRHIRWP